MSVHCYRPVPVMALEWVGTGQPYCCKPKDHELPHANDSGLMWNAEYVGYPT